MVLSSYGFFSEIVSVTLVTSYFGSQQYLYSPFEVVTKNIYCSKLKLLQSLYCLGSNILLRRVVYLVINTYNSFIISMRK